MLTTDQSQDAGHEGTGLGQPQAGLHGQDGGARRRVRGKAEAEQGWLVHQSYLFCIFHDVKDSAE